MEIECPRCKKRMERVNCRVGQRLECEGCGSAFFVRPSAIKANNVMKKNMTDQMDGKSCIYRLVVDRKIGVVLSVLFGVVLCVSGIICCGKAKKPIAIAENIRGAVDVATNSFKYASDRLAVVECGSSSGSAFIVKIGKENFLVTNEHVFRGGKGEKPIVRMLNGQRLEYSEIEVAEDRDLIRIRVDASQKAFDLEEDMPDMGGTVKVFGNSEGGGVATELSGVVLGVGPKKLEIDVKFVRGNSGSPAINEKGRVVGVATLITLDSDKKDWTKKDTRFNEVRRYALRMAGVEWKHYTWSEYAEQVEAISDVDYFCKCLYPFLFAFYHEVDSSYLEYGDLMESNYRKRDSGFHSKMLDVAKEYQSLDAVYTEWMKGEKGRDKFIQQLRDAAEPTDRTAYLEVYDLEVQVQQAKVIERLYDFNDAKLDAIKHLRNKINEWQFDLPQIIRRNDSEEGIKKTKEDLNILEKDIMVRLKNGNVMEIAIDMLTGRNDTKLNRRLGTILLYDWAKDGDEEAQRTFVKMWEDDKLDNNFIGIDKYWSCVRTWFLEAYHRGDKKAAYVLGQFAYDEEKFKEALRLWKESAVAGLTRGWLRIGDFHSVPQGDGGGPVEMRDENIAKDAYQKAKESDRGSDGKVGQLFLGLKLLDSKNPNDWERAKKEFERLMDKEPDEGWHVYYYGKALLRLATKAWNDRISYYEEKAKYWESEKNRANEWIDKHRNDEPENINKYDRYVWNWNRAVGVQKKAYNKIEEIWKPFYQNERGKLLDEWEHAVVIVEKAARMGVKEAKALAEEERKEIEQRR